MGIINDAPPVVAAVATGITVLAENFSTRIQLMDFLSLAKAFFKASYVSVALSPTFAKKRLSFSKASTMP